MSAILNFENHASSLNFDIRCVRGALIVSLGGARQVLGDMLDSVKILTQALESLTNDHKSFKDEFRDDYEDVVLFYKELIKKQPSDILEWKKYSIANEEYGLRDFFRKLQRAFSGKKYDLTDIFLKTQRVFAAIIQQKNKQRENKIILKYLSCVLDNEQGRWQEIWQQAYNDVPNNQELEFWEVLKKVSDKKIRNEILVSHKELLVQQASDISLRSLISVSKVYWLNEYLLDVYTGDLREYFENTYLDKSWCLIHRNKKNLEKVISKIGINNIGKYAEYWQDTTQTRGELLDVLEELSEDLQKQIAPMTHLYMSKDWQHDHLNNHLQYINQAQRLGYISHEYDSHRDNGSIPEIMHTLPASRLIDYLGIDDFIKFLDNDEKINRYRNDLRKGQIEPFLAYWDRLDIEEKTQWVSTFCHFWESEVMLLEYISIELGNFANIPDADRAILAPLFPLIIYTHGDDNWLKYNPHLRWMSKKDLIPYLVQHLSGRESPKLQLWNIMRHIDKFWRNPQIDDLTLGVLVQEEILTIEELSELLKEVPHPEKVDEFIAEIRAKNKATALANNEKELSAGESLIEAKETFTDCGDNANDRPNNTDEFITGFLGGDGLMDSEKEASVGRFVRTSLEKIVTGDVESLINPDNPVSESKNIEVEISKAEISEILESLRPDGVIESIYAEYKYISAKNTDRICDVITKIRRFQYGMPYDLLSSLSAHIDSIGKNMIHLELSGKTQNEFVYLFVEDHDSDNRVRVSEIIPISGTVEYQQVMSFPRIKILHSDLRQISSSDFFVLAVRKRIYKSALEEGEPHAMVYITKDGSRKTLYYGDIFKKCSHGSSSVSKAIQALGKLMNDKGADISDFKLLKEHFERKYKEAQALKKSQLITKYQEWLIVLHSYVIEPFEKL